MQSISVIYLLIITFVNFRQLAVTCRKVGKKWGKILHTQGKRLSLHHHIKILNYGYNHIKVIGKDRQSDIAT